MYRLHQREVSTARAGALSIALLAAPGIARADHAGHAGHDMAMSENHQMGELSAGVTLSAAQYDNPLYLGSYQSVAPAVGWMSQRFGAGASLGLYHLTKNGLSLYGMGDAMVMAHAAIVTTDEIQAGVALHMMFPTGSERDGLGMGHTMAMPSAWATWRADAVSLKASAGYGRALVSISGGAHDHGPSPLVDPMNMQELTWDAGADVTLMQRLRVGGGVRGALPIGSGSNRVIGAGRVGWGTARVSTGLELQVGIDGDPFTVRGVVDTALTF